jgi:mRNA-degrading endonuclease RelE of RelBE toxin-antitoxin system
MPQAQISAVVSADGARFERLFHLTLFSRQSSRKREDEEEQIRPGALTGDSVGLFKLRVRDYRVIYEIVRDQELIVIHLSATVEKCGKR